MRTPVEFNLTPAIVERFWQKVQRLAGGCLEWTASRDLHGYGRCAVGQQRVTAAHRVSWRIHFGDIPSDLRVLHRCDNPPCVNPEHLFLGTLVDNARDAAAKGRLSSQQHPERYQGEKNGQAKLTGSAVREIKQRLANGEGPKSIAGVYGVDDATIAHIKAGRHWTHI